jgi:alanine dehydrogenase
MPNADLRTRAASCQTEPRNWEYFPDDRENIPLLKTAKIAAGFGASVAVLNSNLDRLRHLDDIMPHDVTTLFSDRHTILEQIAKADLVVGAVLIRGARAPRLVRREDLKLMKPGAVVVDVAVDQGGCFETTHATTHAEPTYLVDEIVHYAVANMPGAVGRTNTYALCNATLPYVLQLANRGLGDAVKHNPDLVGAINIHLGQVTNLAGRRYVRYALRAVSAVGGVVGQSIQSDGFFGHSQLPQMHLRSRQSGHREFAGSRLSMAHPQDGHG